MNRRRRVADDRSFSPLLFRLYASDLEQAIWNLHMGLKLQGIAAKVAKLQHDAEFEAAKLDAKVEEVAAKLPTVFSGAHGSIDGLAKNVGDVEALIEQIQSVSNGGPALDDEPKALSGQPIEHGIGPTLIVPIP